MMMIIISSSSSIFFKSLLSIIIIIIIIIIIVAVIVVTIAAIILFYFACLTWLVYFIFWQKASGGRSQAWEYFTKGPSSTITCHICTKHKDIYHKVQKDTQPQVPTTSLTQPTLKQMLSCAFLDFFLTYILADISAYQIFKSQNICIGIGLKNPISVGL